MSEPIDYAALIVLSVNINGVALKASDFKSSTFKSPAQWVLRRGGVSNVALRWAWVRN